MKNEKTQKIKIASDLSFTIGLFTLFVINYFYENLTESQYKYLGLATAVAFFLTGFIEVTSFLSNKLKTEIQSICSKKKKVVFPVKAKK